MSFSRQFDREEGNHDEDLRQRQTDLLAEIVVGLYLREGEAEGSSSAESNKEEKVG